MKNLRNKLKNVKGITLISLVITIIVLIILAGVTLNILLGENGIINRTKTARDENEKATASETMTLKITECQMKAYAENGKLPDLQYIADRFCEDNDIAYVNLEKQKVGAINDKITIGENTSIFTKLEKYPYEFEINSSLQLASIDGVKVATVPTNDDDTIVSMTKAELKKMIQDEINESNKTSFSKTRIWTANDTSTRQVNLNNTEYKISDFDFLLVYVFGNNNSKNLLFNTTMSYSQGLAYTYNGNYTIETLSTDITNNTIDLSVSCSNSNWDTGYIEWIEGIKF